MIRLRMLRGDYISGRLVSHPFSNRINKYGLEKSERNKIPNTPSKRLKNADAEKEKEEARIMR